MIKSTPRELREPVFRQNLEKNQLLIISAVPNFISLVPPKLVSLDLSRTSSRALFIRTLSELSIKTLNISENPLEYLCDIPSLHTLDCSKCLLTKLPTYLPNLVSLNCSDNLLTSIPSYPSLKHLKCNDNLITKLDYTGLLSLSANNNPLLHTVSSYKKASFIDCPIICHVYDATLSRRSAIFKNGKIIWITNKQQSKRKIILDWNNSTCLIQPKSYLAKKIYPFLFVKQ